MNLRRRSTVKERTLEERGRWWKMGLTLKAISDGKLVVLLLSSGQRMKQVCF